MTDRDPNGEDGVGVLLMRTWSDTEAEMVRQLLDAYGIPCQVVSDVPHTVFPISIDGLGEIRIRVPKSHLDEARTALAEHRRRGFEVLPGDKEDPEEPGSPSTESNESAESDESTESDEPDDGRVS